MTPIFMSQNLHFIVIAEFTMPVWETWCQNATYLYIKMVLYLRLQSQRRWHIFQGLTGKVVFSLHHNQATSCVFQTTWQTNIFSWTWQYRESGDGAVSLDLWSVVSSGINTAVPVRYIRCSTRVCKSGCAQSSVKSSVQNIIYFINYINNVS